jgi:hypothetical protein
MTSDSHKMDKINKLFEPNGYNDGKAVRDIKPN